MRKASSNNKQVGEEDNISTLPSSSPVPLSFSFVRRKEHKSDRFEKQKNAFLEKYGVNSVLSNNGKFRKSVFRVSEKSCFFESSRFAEHPSAD